DLLAVDLAHDVDGRVGHRGLLGSVREGSREARLGAPAAACYSSIRSSTDQGGLPERPKGADCKSAAECFAGSNPAPATRAPARTPRGAPGRWRPGGVSGPPLRGDEAHVLPISFRVPGACTLVSAAPIAQSAERLHGKEKV